MHSSITLPMWIIALTTFFTPTISNPLRILVNTQLDQSAHSNQIIQSDHPLHSLLPHIQPPSLKSPKPHTLQVGHVLFYSERSFKGEETSFTIEKNICHNLTSPIRSAKISDVVICDFFEQKECKFSDDEGDGDVLMLGDGSYDEFPELPWEDKGEGLVASFGCYVELGGGEGDGEEGKEIRWPKGEEHVELIRPSIVADEPSIQYIGKAFLYPESKFKGDTEEFKFTRNECHNLSSPVRSAKIENVLICDFFERKDCKYESLEEILMLVDGLYEDLVEFGGKEELESFRCYVVFIDDGDEGKVMTEERAGVLLDSEENQAASISAFPKMQVELFTQIDIHSKLFKIEQPQHLKHKFSKPVLPKARIHHNDIWLFRAPDFVGLSDVVEAEHMKCTPIDKLSKKDVASTIIGSRLCKCIFYANEDCNSPPIGVLEFGKHLGIITFDDFTQAFKCLVCDQLTSSNVKLKSGSKNLDYLEKSSSATNTEVTVYSDFDFRGISQKISAKDDECYNLDASLRNYVLSATLEHKIWFCTFFPTTDCQGDQIFQLGAGEFDNLFPEGMDFVSFKCRIYGDTLELVAIPVGLEMQDEAKVYLKH